MDDVPKVSNDFLRYVNDFVGYLNLECGLSENTQKSYRYDLMQFAEREANRPMVRFFDK